MLYNDFKVLDFTHPKHLVRDTGTSPYAKLKAGLPPKAPAALRQLAVILLGMRINSNKLVFQGLKFKMVSIVQPRMRKRQWLFIG